jgi:hypothetical protein
VAKEEKAVDLSKIQMKEVALSTGKTVVVRELTGADEMLAISLCSKFLKFDGDEATASMLQQLNVQVVLSILKVDDKVLSAPTSYAEVMQLLTTFKQKDFSKIKQAYTELNTPDDFLS